jgi:hypothetical protein
MIVIVFLVRRMTLPTDLATGECGRMDIGIGSVREQSADQRVKVLSRNVFAGMPRTLACVHVPVTVPPFGGHAGVPAGPLPRFVQKNTRMAPDECGLPKWIWAYVTVPVGGCVVPTAG